MPPNTVEQLSDAGLALFLRRVASDVEAIVGSDSVARVKLSFDDEAALRRARAVLLNVAEKFAYNG